MATQIPKTEDGQLNTYVVNGHEYLISLNTTAKRFTLWKTQKKNKQFSYEKICVANSPYKLYDKVKEIENWTD